MPRTAADYARYKAACPPVSAYGKIKEKGGEIMNKLSLELLTFAAQNRTYSNPEVLYVSKDFDSWLSAVEAARLLYENGLIESAMSIITGPAMSKLPGDIPPLAFSITQKGLDCLSRERDSES